MTSEMLGRELEGIEGWLHLDEARQLYEDVIAAQDRGGPLCVVEIGSWKGRSTVAIGLALKARGNGFVHAIDPHRGMSVAHVSQYGTADTFDEFRTNVAHAGVSDVVKPIRDTSSHARPAFDDASVDVLFIDGSHEFEDVLADIAEWRSAVREGGLIAFNDTSKPGVYRALVAAGLTRAESQFRDPVLVRSTLFVKVRSSPWTSQDRANVRRLRLVLGLRRLVHQIVPLLPPAIKWVGNRASQRLVRTSSP